MIPTDSKSTKVMASRSLLGYITENTRLFFWLLKLSMSNKVGLFILQFLFKNNQIDKKLGEVIDDVSQEAVDKHQDIRKDLLFLGYRAFTLRAVVKPASILSAEAAPLRSHFEIPSVLLDGYGKDPFLHRTVGFFEEDRNAFKRSLFLGKDLFYQKVQEHFNLALENPAQWETTPVKYIVRRMVYNVLAEAFLGLTKEQLATVYDELTQSLDTFDWMWQNPDELKPIQMFFLFQTLERISNRLHRVRGPAELPDMYVGSHGRPMNLTAIFFVAANLVLLLTAAILHTCSKESLQGKSFDDLAKILATWRFRESRIFRIDAGIFTSNAPDYSIGGEACLPRSITVIPQGNMNHQRIKENDLVNDMGQVKEPVLFGRRRPCPGASTVYSAVKGLFFVAESKKLKFVPDTAQIKEYDDFIEGLSASAQRQRSCTSPPVVGHWSPLSSN